MRDWDWGDIWRGARLIRIGVVVLAGISGTWYKHARSESQNPRMAAAVLQAFSEEVGFAMPREYQIQPVPRGRTALAVRPDGRRFPARTARVGSLAHRLYVDLVAAGARDSGTAQGDEEAMEGLRAVYGQDLGPNDQLAVVPPGWQICLSR